MTTVPSDIPYVTASDVEPPEINEADRIVGNGTITYHSLQEAIENSCAGQPGGDYMWAKVSHKLKLGFDGQDREGWVSKVNAAIKMWNENKPTSPAEVAALYGV